MTDRLRYDVRQFTDGSIELVVRDGLDEVASLRVWREEPTPRRRDRRYRVEAKTSEWRGRGLIRLLRAKLPAAA